jgi:hypothetical protein
LKCEDALHLVRNWGCCWEQNISWCCGKLDLEESLRYPPSKPPLGIRESYGEGRVTSPQRQICLIWAGRDGNTTQLLSSLSPSGIPASCESVQCSWPRVRMVTQLLVGANAPVSAACATFQAPFRAKRYPPRLSAQFRMGTTRYFLRQQTSCKSWET